MQKADVHALVCDEECNTWSSKQSVRKLFVVFGRRMITNIKCMNFQALKYMYPI